jgi:hypothetical protein
MLRSHPPARAMPRAPFAVVIGIVIAAAVLAAAGVARAQRQSGIQLSPDSATYIISKDVGDERWAITYNLDRKVVIGNVFPQDGGAPSFLSCEITRVDQAADPAQAQYSLRCQFAQSCGTAPCASQWGEPFDVPPIPGSFFLPTGTLSTFAGNVQPILATRCGTSSACHGDGGREPMLTAPASYDATFGLPAGQDSSQAYVAPFDGPESYLLDKILGLASTGGTMPPTAPLPESEIDAIGTWILEGAARN